MAPASIPSESPRVALVCMAWTGFRSCSAVACTLSASIQATVPAYDTWRVYVMKDATKLSTVAKTRFGLTRFHSIRFEQDDPAKTVESALTLHRRVATAFFWHS